MVWMKWTGSKERGSYKAFRWVRVGKKRRRRQVDLGRDERVAKKKLAEDAKRWAAAKGKA